MTKKRMMANRSMIGKSISVKDWKRMKRRMKVLRYFLVLYRNLTVRLTRFH